MNPHLIALAPSPPTARRALFVPRTRQSVRRANCVDRGTDEVAFRTR
jgi:hypothetical protein